MFRWMGHAIGQACTHKSIRRYWGLTLSKHGELWHDLRCDPVVANTLAAALGFVGVVLSPSYATQWVSHQGQRQLYTQALLRCDPSLTLSMTASGVVLVQER